MKKIKYSVLLLVLFAWNSAVSQTITMEFPAFAGKTYDFIIFQGSKAERIIQDTIPENGKFNLTIPAEYAPYTGMSRWLLTNSEFGGGLDMAIPGHDFSITCLSDTPDNTNIIYTGFDAVNELNRLHSEQQIIIDKFDAMSKATQLYDKKHRLYATFQKEKEQHAEAYLQFHENLNKNSSYYARFLPIVNLVSGRSQRLTDDEDRKIEYYNEYITQELNFDDLYVSGHWEGIIQSWVTLQSSVVNDKSVFAQDFKKISDRINAPAAYTDFVGKMTYFLIQYGKDDYIEAIAPMVVASGKITAYEGKTMEVYVKAMVGMQAPDLVITEHIGKYEDHNHQTTIIKSKDFAKENVEKTLLLFYQSGCGPCEELLQQLPGKYEDLKKKGIDIIAVSADENQQVFENSSRYFLWERSYCDLEGTAGVNFRQYAVMGTPMMFLIDKDGRIEEKIVDINQLLVE
jgi:peroxiredoxin